MGSEDVRPLPPVTVGGETPGNGGRGGEAILSLVCTFEEVVTPIAVFVTVEVRAVG